jgi:RNA-directed DNA polymerase
MPIFPRYEGPALMEQVCSVENLTPAWRRVRSNIHVTRRGRSAGTDAVTLRDFEADWPRQMAQLAEELRSGVYQPLPPKRVALPKASGGERAIAILAVRDRIAQRAVQQVLEPVFDPLFLDCSYGCRPRVGVPHAVERVVRYADQGLGWVVDADIASYFDSIDQRILLGLLRQRINEAPLLRLIAQWLAMGALTSDNDAALRAHAPTPLEQGGAALRRLMAWGDPPIPEMFEPAPPFDPYTASIWESAGTGGAPAYGWGAPAAGLEQRIWNVVMLAKPVITGARLAAPYIQRLGGRRLALAGAAAAGAVAVGEVTLRYLRAAPRGTMQGGALSPLLANIYLHPFDIALTSQGIRLVRFMDDFVVMCASKHEAETALALVQRQLATLRLTLNSEKTRVVAYFDGIEFLGQALAPRRRGSQLAEGVTTFEEAEKVLRAAAERMRRKR